MAAFLVRRALSGLLVVALLTFLTFFVFNAIPTNPACLVVACGPHTTTNDAQIREADHQLGIDRSLFVQYGDWVGKLLRHGDLGKEWTGNSQVRTAITSALPITASLVGGGMALMLLLALPLGCLSAMRPRSVADRGLLAFSVVGLAIHPFVLSFALLQFFVVKLHVYDFSYCPLTGAPPHRCGGPLDWAHHLVVPWFIFALFFLPLYMRMIRVRLLETFSEPWISTARAKGASETRVVLGHALRNAIGPVLPMIAIDAGTAITAAIYIETVFGLQGLGMLAVRAFSGQAGGYDLPLTAGIVLTVGVFVVVLNIVADAAAAWLDPRTRERAATGLIPLPQAVTSRPQLRRALMVALTLAAVAAIALTSIQHGKPKASSTDLGSPVHTVHTSWDGTYRLITTSPPIRRGYLETRVSVIEIGSTGWRVHATLTNHTPLPIPVSQPATDGLFPIRYPQQGMSLLVRTPDGYGGNELKPFQARDFQPPLPPLLKPRASWHGTFTGDGPIPHHALVYVGFGRFVWDNRFVSTSTDQAITSP